MPSTASIPPCCARPRSLSGTKMSIRGSRAASATGSQTFATTGAVPEMPSPDVLERFIARVEANFHAEAIEEFYAPGASMQENDLPARVGRDALAANERKVLARM